MNQTDKMRLKFELTLLSVLWTMIVGAVAGASNLETGACEPIKVDMCKQIGYNNTGNEQLFV
jgi:hypothetical protein